MGPFYLTLCIPAYSIGCTRGSKFFSLAFLILGIFPRRIVDQFLRYRSRR
jgi:hypothetical protein